jgi:hypothetical protein
MCSMDLQFEDSLQFEFHNVLKIVIYVFVSYFEYFDLNTKFTDLLSTHNSFHLWLFVCTKQWQCNRLSAIKPKD